MPYIGLFPPFAEWTGKVTSLDLSTWKHHVDLLSERRSSVATEELEAAVRVIIRAAAFDTGALEGLYATNRGFTFTVIAHQALEWEGQLKARSEIALPLFEAQLATYELLLDAASNETPISEAWIRRLHESLCSAYPYYEVRKPDGVEVRALPLGAYKQEPNHVLQADGGVHAYAPVIDTPAEMGRLVEELETPRFLSAHPVVQAAYSHYALVAIHPFTDGNGRVARALASAFLFKALSLPLVILVDHRDQYIDCLEAADRGEYQPLTLFVYERGLDAVELILDALEAPDSPRLEDSVEELRRLLTVKGTLSHTDIDKIAYNLLQTVAA